KHFTLADWGLELRVPRRRFNKPAPKYISLESRQMFLEPTVPKAVREAGLKAAPTLVYLVNNIATRTQQVRAAVAALAPDPAPLLKPLVANYGPIQVPYSIVAALEPGRKPPLGPFLPEDVKRLKDNEIVLADWEGSPWRKAPRGTVIT